MGQDDYMDYKKILPKKFPRQISKSNNITSHQISDVESIALDYLTMVHYFWLFMYK